MKSSDFGFKIHPSNMGSIFDDLLATGQKALQSTYDKTLTSVQSKATDYLQANQDKLIAAGINLMDKQVSNYVPDTLTQEQQKQYLARVGQSLTQGALTGGKDQIDQLKKYGIIVGGVVVVAMLGMLAVNISAVRGARKAK